MAGSSEEAAAVRAALAAGRLTVPDPETGFHRPLHAVCPGDGARAPVRRLVRGARGAITEVTARCPRCGAELTPGPEGLRLG